MTSIDHYTNQIHCGDCFNVLLTIPDNSVHAVVTDPPYGLAFMGRSWDDFEPKEYQEWCENWAKECLRVLKPGGHMLAFSGNRTHHRLFTGVEDAGFEIRDTLTWHYGSGFPKALDVGKQLDKRGGRHVMGVGGVIKQAREEKGLSTRDVAAYFADEGQEPTGCVWNWENGASNPTVENFNKLIDVLDLDIEPISSADRDVVDKKTRGNRSGTTWGENTPDAGIYDTDGPDEYEITAPATDAAKKWDGFKTALKPSTEFIVLGRKPFDSTVAENIQAHGTGALNIGETRIESDGSHKRPYQPTNNERDVYGEQDGFQPTNAEGRYPSNLIFDEDAAKALDEQEDEDVSRYFYTSKATKAERTLDGKIDNSHPTVKPQDLMEWLIKLVTAENQIVLDPFCGSGTTCKAAKALNRQFIGIERQAKWADVARVRVGLTPDDPSVVRDDDSQRGLEGLGDMSV